ncbi:MAG: PAS domain S-box protein [Rhodothermales bacterium]|nr:PAS domain S-box protein [Rhodothermales bacterium]MBO6780166.1 PAS domain S-box protein [Rhodothermales bacterium]
MNQALESKGDASARLLELEATNRRLLEERDEALRGARELSHQLQIVSEAALHNNRRYRAVLDSQHEFISRSLPDTTLTYVNEAYCRYFGCTRDKAVGTSFLRFVNPDHREAARGHFEDLVANPRVVEYQHEVVRPDGSRAWNEWVDVPIRDESGRVVEFQSVGRDITAQREAQLAFEESSSRLEAIRAIEKAMLAAKGWREVAEIAVGRLAEMVPPGRVTVYVQDASAAEFHLAASSGNDHLKHPALPVVDVEEVIGLQLYGLLTRGQEVQVADMDAMATNSTYVQRVRSFGARSGFIIPLMARGQFFGALLFSFIEPHAFTDHHVRIARELSNTLSLAIWQARIVDQLRATNDKLRLMSRELVETEERRRRYVAAELHEEIAQMLAAAKMGLHAARSDAPIGVGEDLDHQIKLVGDTLEQVRSLSMLLRPNVLEEQGLFDAMSWLVDRQAGLESVEVDLELPDERPSLSPAAEITCYRIVQAGIAEALRAEGLSSLALLAQVSKEMLVLHVIFDGTAQRTSGELLQLQERTELLGGTMRLSRLPGGKNRITAAFVAGD